jgi:hypothetical protein
VGECKVLSPFHSEKDSHRVIFSYQPLELSMEMTLSYLRLTLAQIINNKAQMSFICPSNEKVGTGINALVAETLRLTSIVASCPGFPEIQIQQCNVSQATTNQKMFPSFKELAVFTGSKLFEHLCNRDGHSYSAFGLIAFWNFTYYK